MAEALYRKYRPQIFEDVVGQEHIERTIKNAIDQDKVSHAYLFCGPRGTGKTTTARLLAKALLCEQGPTPEPDGTCGNCIDVANGEHPDVYELDAASRTGVENVREEIIGRVQFAPTRGRFKVYIIDEVHMLSTAAFNALLKTLEEPPSHVVFILCTTDSHKVPETIHSRCQRFDFHRIAAEAIVSRLGAICVAEEVEFEGDALDLIAHRAEGGMRNALTSLEQLIAFGEGKVTLELAERLLGSLDVTDMAEIVTAIGQRDIASCFVWTSNYVETGADLAQFVRDLAEHIRNMYVLSLAGNDTPLEISEATRREIINEMQYFGSDRLSRMLGVLGDLSAELKTSSNPRLSFEIALTRMVRPDSDLTLESLAERIEALESGHSAVAHVLSSPASKAEPSAALQTQPEPAPVQPQVQAQQPSQPTTSEQAKSASVEPVKASVAAAEQQSAQQTAQQARSDQQSSAQQTASHIESDQPIQQEPVSQASLSQLENPAALQRVWQATLNAIKKQQAAYGALFINTKASFDAAKQEVIIEFPASNAFAYLAVQKPETVELVSQCLQQAVGQHVTFRYTKAEASDQSSASPVVSQPAQQAQPAQQPIQQTQPQALAPMQQSTQAHAVQSSSEPRQVQAQPQPQPQATATYDDSVPLDMYDSVPDPDASYEPVLDTTTAPTYAPELDNPADVSNSTSSAEASELESLLSMGFGEGVSFEEVDE